MSDSDTEIPYLARRLNGTATPDGILISADVARSILAEREIAEGMSFQSKLLKNARGPVVKVDKSSILWTDSFGRVGGHIDQIMLQAVQAARAMGCKIIATVNSNPLMVTPRVTLVSVWEQYCAQSGDSGPRADLAEWDAENPPPRWV